MADTKISGLSALTDPVTNDLVEVVDVSDTSMAASGTNKKLTIDNLATAVGGSRGGLGAITANGATSIDLATAAQFAVTLTASATFSLSNDADGDGFMLYVRGQASGYTITWWSNIKWADGAAPTIPTVSGRVLPIGFKRLGTTEWLGVPGKECY